MSEHTQKDTANERLERQAVDLHEARKRHAWLLERYGPLLDQRNELLTALRTIRLVAQQQRGDFMAPPSEDTLNMDDAIDIATAAIEKAEKG